MTYGSSNTIHGAAPTDAKSFSWLLRTLREDHRLCPAGVSEPGFQAVAVHRFGVWALQQPLLLRRALSIVYRGLHVVVRNVYGIELPRRTKVGRRLRIAHQSGIVISPYAEIGDDCLIRQNVTLGMAASARKRRPPLAPRLGNGVEVGSGAVLIGGITVGDGARIGPNAVVMTDVPAGGSAFAAPAKVMAPLVSAARSEAR